MSVFCTGLPTSLIAPSSFPFPVIQILLLILLPPPVATGLKPFTSSCYSNGHIQIPWHCFLLLLCVSFLAHLPFFSFTVFSHPFELQVLAHTAHSILFVHFFLSFIHHIFTDHLLGTWHSAGQLGTEFLRRDSFFLLSHTLRIVCFCCSMLLASHAIVNMIVNMEYTYISYMYTVNH